MIQVLLAFIPVLMLVVLANMATGWRIARLLLYVLLGGLSAMTCLTGLLWWLAPSPALAERMSDSGISLGPAFGQWLAISGGLALLLVLASAWMSRGGRLWRTGHVCLSCPLPLTALVLALLYAASNAALLAGLSAGSLADLPFQFGVAELGAQTLGMVALALLGVGLGIRRDWPAVVQRLGWRPLRQRDVGVIMAATIAMVMLSVMVSAVVSLLFPSSITEVDDLNRQLIAPFSSVGGAVLLGLLSGVGEEVLYRGALQPAFGIWLTSLIFALHHVQYLNPALLIIFLLGLFLGWVRNRWGLGVAAFTHACYNTLLVYLAMNAVVTGV